MSDNTSVPEVPERTNKLPLIVGMLALVALGGGSFYAVFSGKILVSKDEVDIEVSQASSQVLSEVRFVALEPLLVSINRTDPPRQLRLEAQLEVHPSNEREVESLMPRVMDAMNSYLRAIEMTDLRDPSALLRIRAQLLRRIQVITGEGRVQGLLVTKFLVS